MAQMFQYQTLNNLGVDPTTYYVASASVTPEYPAPPFLPGSKAFGSDGSEFIFVQASTSISLTDFVMITVAASGGPLYDYNANSLTSTNVASSLAVGIGSTGIILKQSLSFIPAGAFFWAQTKGQYIPATTSGGTLATAAPVALFTTATAGVLSSTSAATAGAFAGIICINSLTVSIPSSIVPPLGATQSNGFTVGPVVNMNNPRSTMVFASTGTPLSLNLFSF